MRDLSHPSLRIEWCDLERQIPRIERGTIVVHLAALRAGAKQSRERYLALNRDATLRLAEAAIRGDAARFINVSTAMVFGPSRGERLDESSPIQGFARANSYIGSKIQALERTEMLVPNGLPLVTIFPSIVYGPDHPSAPNRVTSHIRRLLAATIRFHPADVSRLRTLAYVDDVVSGIRAAIDRDLEPGSRFILGGEDISMGGFETLVLELSGRWAPALRAPSMLSRGAVTALDMLGRKESGGGYRAQLSILSKEWTFTSRRAEEILACRITPLHIGIEKTIQLLKTTRR